MASLRNYQILSDRRVEERQHVSTLYLSASFTCQDRQAQDMIRTFEDLGTMKLSSMLDGGSDNELVSFERFPLRLYFADGTQI